MKESFKVQRYDCDYLQKSSHIVLTSILFSFDKEHDSLTKDEKVKEICKRLDVPIDILERAQKEMRLWRDFAEGKRKSDEEKYPRLAAFNMLPSNGDARDRHLKEMRLVMGEIVKYHEEMGKPLKMLHSNFKEAGVVVLPKVKNKKAFLSMSKVTGWLDKLFALLQDGISAANHESANSCILQWVLELFCKERAQETAAAAKALGWTTTVEQMSEVEAAAMWSDANITKQARLTILRHLRAKFGRSFQVSNSKVETLAEDAVPVVSGQYQYKIDHDAKPETISYWISDASRVVLNEIERNLACEYAGMSRTERRTSDITYGYCTKVRGNEKGLDIITGADHGGGALRFFAKVNLLSPDFRREHGLVEGGCPVRQFGCVECKHDDAPIVAKVSGEFDDGVRHLNNSQLFAVRNKVKGLVQAFLLPRDATGIHLTSDTNEKGDCQNVALKFETEAGGGVVEHEVRKDVVPRRIENLTLWRVVDRFTNLTTGDLAFFATIHGRDGASGAYCPYCDLSWTEMNQNDEEEIREGCPLTIARLNDLAGKSGVERKGVKMAPLCPSIEPSRCAIPLLHCMMGMVNKCWDMLLDFLDEDVAIVSEEEQALRQKISDQKEEKLRLEAQIQEEKAMLASHSYQMRIGITKQIREKQKKLRQLPQSSLTAGPFQINLVQARDDFNSQTQHHRNEKRRLEGVKRNLKSQIKIDKAELEPMKAARKRKDGDISSLVEKILFEHANVNKAAYHGGKFEGGSCRNLLDKNKKVMEEIKLVCDDMIKIPRAIVNPCSQEVLDQKIAEISDLLSALDAVFSLLRLVKPSEEEIEHTKKAVAILKRLWKQAGISTTIKTHIIFDHAVEQMIQFEGLGDKCEDFIERGHQIGNKLSHLTARMGNNYKAKFCSQRKREYMNTHPLVKTQTKTVNDKCKRVYKRPHQRETRDQIRKRGRIETRRAFLASF